MRHIALYAVIFPVNTPGFILDILTRKFLWEIEKDFEHGTGHGVGSVLNVHEGPQSISPYWKNTYVLQNGMIISNEPGYYKNGDFGIRTENQMVVAYVRT